MDSYQWTLCIIAGGQQQIIYQPKNKKVECENINK